VTELGDWWCDEQEELELDDGPNPDDARDLAIDDDLLDHLPSRPIVDVDVHGGLL
jgi:hypothetical protein